ncbi:MAG: hypothetical protein OSB65_07530 [Roseibacillus sp.]|nr:hypothetical protein [Roseibacillus sp.]
MRKILRGHGHGESDRQANLATALHRPLLEGAQIRGPQLALPRLLRSVVLQVELQESTISMRARQVESVSTVLSLA